MEKITENDMETGSLQWSMGIAVVYGDCQDQGIYRDI